MKKKETSVTVKVKAYERFGGDLEHLSNQSIRSPLDDIALRVIVLNIPKHRSTGEETAKDNTEICTKGKKPKAA